MKRLIATTVMVALFSCFTAMAVTVVDGDNDQQNEKVYNVVEQMPQYPGGPAALMKYISESIKYPAEAKKAGIQGRVIISFEVSKDGSLKNIHIIKSCGKSLDNEAIRVVKSMKKWEPGMQEGKPVRVKYCIPITFKL
jgi:protein TonB